MNQLYCGQENGRHSSRPEKDLIFAQPHLKKGKRILPTLNFLSWFLSSPSLAHLRARSCARKRANPTHKTKTHAKKFFQRTNNNMQVSLFISSLYASIMEKRFSYICSMHRAIAITTLFLSLAILSNAQTFT